MAAALRGKSIASVSPLNIFSSLIDEATNIRVKQESTLQSLQVFTKEHKRGSKAYFDPIDVMMFSLAFFAGGLCGLYKRTHICKASFIEKWPCGAFQTASVLKSCMFSPDEKAVAMFVDSNRTCNMFKKMGIDSETPISAEPGSVWCVAEGQVWCPPAFSPDNIHWTTSKHSRPTNMPGLKWPLASSRHAVFTSWGFVVWGRPCSGVTSLAAFLLGKTNILKNLSNKAKRFLRSFVDTEEYCKSTMETLCIHLRRLTWQVHLKQEWRITFGRRGRLF